jgi:hypothetical protein
MIRRDDIEREKSDVNRGTKSRVTREETSERRSESMSSG